MSRDPSAPFEVEGVLNPATAWGTDGELYLYPRLVAEGNVSRVGKARVILVDGVPTGWSGRASFWNLIAPGSTAFGTAASKTPASPGCLPSTPTS